MEWKLNDERKKQYDQFVKSAQEIELAVGSAEYRKGKLIDARKDIDAGIKKWWEEVTKELKLDANKDYMLSSEGAIKEVERNSQGGVMRPIETVPKPLAKPETKIGSNASELK